MELEDPRPPTPAEMSVYNFLLTRDFPNAQALRDQASRIRVQTNCTCGCGSFYVLGDTGSRSDRAWRSPAAWDAERAIEMFMFESTGFLAAVEITYFAGDPAGVPDVSRFSWAWSV